MKIVCKGITVKTFIMMNHLNHSFTICVLLYARAARGSPSTVVRRVSVNCCDISSANMVRHGGRHGAGARVEHEEREKGQSIAN